MWCDSWDHEVSVYMKEFLEPFPSGTQTQDLMGIRQTHNNHTIKSRSGGSVVKAKVVLDASLALSI